MNASTESTEDSTYLSLDRKTGSLGTRRCTVESWAATDSQGHSLEVDVLRWKSAGVAIACEDQMQRLLLLRRWRLGTHRVSYECPMGTVESGDDSDGAAASRELIEETGIQPRSWRRLGSTYPLPGLSDLCFSVWHARASEDVVQLDPLEASGHVWVGRDEASALVRAGAILDAITLAAIQHWLSTPASCGMDTPSE